ncbi:MAG: hypothetical protein AB7K09_12780 [Planctomycetota bacterium]
MRLLVALLVVALCATLIAMANWSVADAQDPQPDNTAPATAAAAATSKVVGLKVSSEPYADEDEMRPFNDMPGTTLAVLIQLPGGGIIDLDRDHSKMTSLVDSTGKSLAGGSHDGMGHWPKVSADGKAALVEFSGKGRPAAGATFIRLVGTVRLTTATTKETFKLATELKTGNKITLGPMTYTIGNVGKPEWGDEPLEVTFANDGDDGVVAGLRFYDADGTLIESKRGSRSRMSFGRMVKCETSWSLSRDVRNVRIELDAWTDRKERDVPIDVRGSLGD